MNLINEVHDSLHEQIFALQDANIIPLSHKGGSKDTKEADGSQKKQKDPESGITNGGLGNLDIAVLNSRARSTIEGGMDPGLFERVNGLLDELLAKPEGADTDMAG